MISKGCCLFGCCLTFLGHSVFHLIIFQKDFEIKKRKYYGIGTNYQNILDDVTEPLIFII